MERIEELTREAVALPVEQRMALVRALLELESVGSLAEAEQSWDEELRARIKAVDEGRAEGIDYRDVQREMNERHT